MTSVSERRLRPIYDSLDCGNSKKALQEADRLLKKQPNFACAKVLRALALLRLDRQEESRRIVEAVVSELPTDENSLQALTICYKELHEPHKICDLYEAVVKKEPTNEEFLSHLFMAFVRVMNYKKQQQTAMTLYKAWPKNPYYFWAVMSVLMQAIDVKEGSLMSPSVALRLAERMLQKIDSENKMEAEAEVQLYLMVLEKQENYKAALDILNGKLAELLRAPNLIKTKRMLYLEKLGRWHDLALFSRELIREDPSQWQYYQTHLKAVFAVHDERPAADENHVQASAPAENHAPPAGGENHIGNRNRPTPETAGGAGEPATAAETIGDTGDQPPAAVETAGSTGDQPPAAAEKAGETTPPAANGAAAGPAQTAEFLVWLCAAAGGRERAPQLAQLRLALELQQRRLPRPAPIDDVEEVLRFLRCYGDRPCCFSDVEPVLALVRADQVPLLLERAEAMVQLDDNRVPATTAHLQRHLTWLQLCQHYSGTQQLGETRLARVAELCRYHQGTTRFSDGLLDTELRPNDHYLTLAVYCLYDEWTATDDTRHLLHALTLLHYGVQLSPSNFYFKLAAIHIYHLLGAAGAAYTVYNRLDLKSIQLDTLSYVCSRHVAAQGQLAAAQLVFNTVLKFFNNVKDTTECLIAAYKVGSFQQIPEFVELKNRLANSTNYWLTLTDCTLLDLTSVASQHAQTLELLRYTALGPALLGGVQWDQLRDNRDLAVLPTFSDAERRRRDADGQLSWRQDVQLLRVRQLMLRALVAVLELAAPQNGDVEALQRLATQLAEAARPPESLAAPPGRPQLSGPLPSRLCRLLGRPHLELLSRLLEAAAALAGGGRPDQPAAEVERLCGRLAEPAATDAAARPAAVLEEAALLTETVSLAAAVCGALHAWAAPARTSGRRGKKKKGAVQAMSESDEAHNRLVTAVLELSRAGRRHVEQAGPALAALCAAAQLERLQLAPAAAEPLQLAGVSVLQRLEASYRASLQELGKVLQYKVEYLTACLL